MSEERTKGLVKKRLVQLGYPKNQDEKLNGVIYYKEDSYKDLNEYLKMAFSKASKKLTGYEGSPDYTVTTDNRNIIMVVECKKDVNKHQTYDNLNDYRNGIIGHSVSNNGIVSRTSPLDSYTLYDHRRTLSLAHIGNFCSYVQDEDFYIGTRVKALKLKNYILEKYYGNTLDKCVLMYISSIINMESFRFSYGRVGGDKVGNLEIKLPGKKLPNGNFELVINPETNKEIVIPDFEFMERYIKSLKYSSAIKE